jgi:hypothetical protein
VGDPQQGSSTTPTTAPTPPRPVHGDVIVIADRGVAESPVAAVVEEELLKAMETLAVDSFAVVDLIMQVVDRRRTFTATARGTTTTLIVMMATQRG